VRHIGAGDAIDGEKNANQFLAPGCETQNNGDSTRIAQFRFMYAV